MKRRAALAAALVLLAPDVVRAAEDDGLTPFPVGAIAPKEEKEPQAPFSFRKATGWTDLPTKLDVSGYLQPQFQIVGIKTALPRDKFQYGARGTRLGFAFYGTPLEKFTYVAHLVVAPAGVEDLTLLSPSATSTIGFSLPTSTQTAIYIEEASLGYRPADYLQVKAGLMHVPFSLGQTTPIPAQMMPFRPPVTGEFQSGDDAALLGSFRLFDAKLFLHAAAFLGTSLGGLNANQTVRGPSFLAAVAAHPLGEMSMHEGDESRGPFRFAFGIGTIYRHATAFDPTGYEASKFDDVRLAAWARVSARGFYAQAEALRRNRTDDVSGRPDKSEGFYGAATYFQPVGKVGFAPVLRAGTIQTSADFSPRRFTSLEGGLAFYPRATEEEPERLRILFEYFFAQVSPLDETQHEGLVQLQLEF